MRSRTRRLLFIAPLAVLGLALFTCLGGEIVMLLWNWLLPPLFGWRQITFWQALALLALCRILFGGLGHHGGRRSHAGLRRRMADRMADLRMRRVLGRVGAAVEENHPHHVVVFELEDDQLGPPYVMITMYFR